MMVVSDSVIEISPQTYLPVRRSRAVTGHAVGTDGSCAQKILAVLRFVFTPFDPAL